MDAAENGTPRSFMMPRASFGLQDAEIVRSQTKGGTTHDNGMT